MTLTPDETVGRTRCGVIPYSFSGLASSPDFDRLQEFAAASLIRSRIKALSPKVPATSVGCEFVGGQASAVATHVNGVVAEVPGIAQPPKTVSITNAGPGVAADTSELWVYSEATPFEVTYAERTPMVRVTVPIDVLTADLSPLDLVKGVAVAAPPIASHLLHSLARTAAGDVNEWHGASSAVIDRYLAGIAGLIVSAIVDDGLAEFTEHDRNWLRLRAIELIELRYQNPGLSPQRMAGMLGVSLRSLCRAFEGGSGIAETLRSRRVSSAASILREPTSRSLTISAIARRCGFVSLATFERTFRDTYQVSPTSYRDESMLAEIPG
jgi:AraC-like DNA-binding protein